MKANFEKDNVTNRYMKANFKKENVTNRYVSE